MGECLDVVEVVLVFGLANVAIGGLWQHLLKGIQLLVLSLFAAGDFLLEAYLLKCETSLVVGLGRDSFTCSLGSTKQGVKYLPSFRSTGTMG